MTHVGRLNPISECFPRRIGFPEQITVQSQGEFITKLDENLNTSNCFTAINSDRQTTEHLYDMTYIDIDSKKIEEATKEMKILDEFLLDYYDCQARINYTANKGYAIYIDYNETEFDFYKSYLFVDHLRTMLNLKHIDLKVSKDHRRISRIPYSINFKALKNYNETRLCIPIDPNWSYSQILKESKHCGFNQDVIIEPSKTVLDIIKSIVIPKLEYDYNYESVDGSEVLSNILKNAKRFVDGRKRIIFELIVPLLLLENKTEEEIHEYCCQFVADSGKNYGEFRAYVNYHIQRNANHVHPPMNLEYFMVENPDIFGSV